MPAQSDNDVQIKESELLKIIDKNRALDATYKLIEIILDTTEFNQLVQKIANTIPAALGYEFGLVLLNEPKYQKLAKVALSDMAPDSKVKEKIYAILNTVSIPFGYADNLSIKSMSEKTQVVTPFLWEVLKPAITQDQAKYLQEVFDTHSIIVTPFCAHERIIGVLIVGLTKPFDKVTDFEKEMLKKFSQNAGIAIENSKLYSNLKMAKDDLHKAYENLKVLNTLKDEFLSVASHELRTPMTIVKSYLWMLDKQKAGRLNKKQNEYLQKALNGTQRMIALINDMLDISKFEQKKVTFSITQIDLVAVVKEVLSNFEIKLSEKRLRAAMHKEYETIYVDADEQKLKEILTNLLENAIKFTKQGGITIGIDEEQEEYKVWIKDSGSGIDRRDLQKLFHKFGRIDNSYTIATESGGTGLGLYIVKLYVQGMGGEVGANSEGPNTGSTFWFTLPKNKIKKYAVDLKQIDIPIQESIAVQQANETA